MGWDGVVLGLDGELQLFGSALRQYVTKEIEPELDRICDGDLPALTVLQGLGAAVGIGGTQGLSLTFSSGSGGDEVVLASLLVMKELGRVAPGLAIVLGGSAGLVAGCIRDGGTAEQAERWGRPLLDLGGLGAWCLTESEAGSDAFGGMRTRAAVQGDGTYRLNGLKTFITNAPVADLFLIYARVQGGPADGEVRAFVLERGMPGLETGAPFIKMGMEESPTGEVFLDDVRVTEDRVLGGTGARGRQAVKRSMSDERMALPAVALGIVERCYEEALAHAARREQFGRPIGEFQAVQLRLAEMLIHVQNCRHWVQRLASEPRDPSLACLAKAYTARAAVAVALDAVQILGGMGYMREGRVEKLARDAKLLEIGAGTTDINLLAAARIELGLGT